MLRALPERTLLIERAATNRARASQTLNDATYWGAGTGISVTPNAGTAPDGTLTADLIINAGSTVSQALAQTISFTASGTKGLALYVKQWTPRASGVSVLGLWDATAVASRHRVQLTWTNGVPNATTEAVIANNGTALLNATSGETAFRPAGAKE